MSASQQSAADIDRQVLQSKSAVTETNLLSVTPTRRSTIGLGSGLRTTLTTLPVSPDSGRHAIAPISSAPVSAPCFLSKATGVTVAEAIAFAAKNTTSLAARNLDVEWLKKLPATTQQQLVDCVAAGVAFPDAAVGCYARRADDYDRFEPFFGGVVKDFHGFPRGAQHAESWDMSALPGLPDGQRFTVKAIGPAQLHIRVRASRNYSELPLPAAMTRAERVILETRVCKVFELLEEHPEFSGRYYSLTPGHKDFVSGDEVKRLEAKQSLFKAVTGKRLLKAAGTADDWPVGRGAYVSVDGSYSIWVGEEDHLRVTVESATEDLMVPFERMRMLLDMLSTASALTYAVSPTFGYVTSCPTRLGTTLFASLQLKLAHLSRDKAKAKSIGQLLGFKVEFIERKRVFELSIKKRVGLTEAKTVANLWTTIKALYRADAALGSG